LENENKKIFWEGWEGKNFCGELYKEDLSAEEFIYKSSLEDEIIMICMGPLTK
jgi:hypothetical protein